MSDTPFYQTRIGRTFFDHTMPELVRQLSQLNVLLQQLIDHSQPEKSSMEPVSAGVPTDE
ncbi:MAG: hypothetical protein JXX14_14455 [Deltaproteobacteria bacterium]|nr:hypothetical protein [Deltaproteobacteria bacterium]